jgi:type VI secretion system protein ImpH
MATSSRRQAVALTEQLRSEPYRFDFFQAVRLLRRMASEQSPDGARQPVGEDHAPGEEIVRFRALPSHNFPAGPISSFRALEGSPSDLAAPPEMTVAFLGLFGPSGVLPRHYTQLVIDRTRHKDFGLRNFLDLFHHRLISLYYRAWEKYRFPIGYERTALEADGSQQDLFTNCLYSLVGWGTGGLRQRLEVTDDSFLYYGGLFAHYPRNAISLERMVADYFDLPAEILQFQGQWLYLADEDQTRMPSSTQREGQNNRLGHGALIGDRVWGIENKFRVRIGPLSYGQFRGFLPDGDQLVLLGQLVRSYVGPDFDFDVQLVLRKAEVPVCRLAASGSGGSRLGWDMWLYNEAPNYDVDDAVFVSEGLPLR